RRAADGRRRRHRHERDLPADQGARRRLLCPGTPVARSRRPMGREDRQSLPLLAGTPRIRARPRELTGEVAARCERGGPFCIHCLHGHELRTGNTPKRLATSVRPNPSLHPTRYSELRPLPRERVNSNVRGQGDIMTVKRMDNVGIVVEDIDAAIAFFTELGLELEGRAPIEGDWADGVTGVRGQRVEIAMMRTPDGHSRLELSRFDAPAIASDHRTAPVNSLGYLRVMFTVGDIDDTLARLSKLGATVVDEVVNYEDIYRLCYIRGPEGILIGLAQELR